MGGRCSPRSPEWPGRVGHLPCPVPTLLGEVGSWPSIHCSWDPPPDSPVQCWLQGGLSGGPQLYTWPLWPPGHVACGKHRLHKWHQDQPIEGVSRHKRVPTDSTCTVCPQTPGVPAIGTSSLQFISTYLPSGRKSSSLISWPRGASDSSSLAHLFLSGWLSPSPSPFVGTCSLRSGWPGSWCQWGLQAALEGLTSVACLVGLGTGRGAAGPQHTPSGETSAQAPH